MSSVDPDFLIITEYCEFGNLSDILLNPGYIIEGILFFFLIFFSHKNHIYYSVYKYTFQNYQLLILIFFFLVSYSIVLSLSHHFWNSILFFWNSILFFFKLQFNFGDFHLKKMSLDSSYGMHYLHSVHLIHRDLKGL